jgi:hypothetical protein
LYPAALAAAVCVMSLCRKLFRNVCCCGLSDGPFGFFSPTFGMLRIPAVVSPINSTLSHKCASTDHGIGCIRLTSRGGSIYTPL